MDLYVANCTEQNHDFIYRQPEKTQIFRKEIRAGAQIKLEKLSQEEVDMIVNHHAAFGMVDHKEIDRTKPYAGLCYSIGREISVDKIRRGLDHNHEVLTERGKELRKEAAVGAATKLGGDGVRPSALEMSVIEDSKDKDSEVNETVRVERDGERTPTKRGRR